VKTSIAVDPGLIVSVSQLPSSMVALWGALSSFFQATTSPTLAWTGCGVYAKFLIVTVAAAVAPAGAVAQAALVAGADEAGLPAATLGLAPELGLAATLGLAALLAAGLVVALPPQAARPAVARTIKRDRARRRIGDSSVNDRPPGDAPIRAVG
jgi:hypothetical protein